MMISKELKRKYTNEHNLHSVLANNTCSSKQVNLALDPCFTQNQPYYI